MIENVLLLMMFLLLLVLFFGVTVLVLEDVLQAIDKLHKRFK